LKQPEIITLHQLKASAEIWLNPTINIGESVGEHTTFIANTLVGRQHVVVFETFNNHKEHAQILCQWRCRLTTRWGGIAEGPV
jgi:hypothetical protein